MLLNFFLFLLTFNLSDSLFNSMVYTSDIYSFKNYLIMYNKNYNHSEFLNRYQIFKDNIGYINHNNRYRTYELGINNFTDLSPDEFKSIYLNNNFTTLNDNIERLNYCYRINFCEETNITYLTTVFNIAISGTSSSV